MARKRKTITLTDEHITLIANIKFEKFVFEDKEHYSRLKDLVEDLQLSQDKQAKEINKTVLDEIHSFNPHSRFGWGCDQWSLFGGTYLYEDMAMILGYFDQAIENSENLATGRRFPIELENKMYSLYEYIYEHLEEIISLVLYFINRGGLTAGVYEYDNYNWIKKEDKK